jgi:superoxide dismutase, Fe-Mn family
MHYEKLEAETFSENLYSMDGISKESVEEHMKLYNGYITKYNAINEELGKLTAEDYAAANQIYSKIRALKVDLSFAWGGVVNHEIYFGHLGGKGGKPTGALLAKLEEDYGSYENWETDLKATGLAARGWVWLGYNHAEDRLFNYLGDAQNTFPVWGVTPILALDVYEHAYFADYGVARAKYIEAFLQNLDWEMVEESYEMVTGENEEESEE